MAFPELLKPKAITVAKYPALEKGPEVHKFALSIGVGWGDRGACSQVTSSRGRLGDRALKPCDWLIGASSR